MTGPRPLSPEEWDAQSSSRVLSPEEWDAQNAKPLPKLNGKKVEGVGFGADNSRVGGLPDSERWKAAMSRPSTAEKVALGMLGFPFEAVKNPVATAKAVAVSTLSGFDAGRLGRYAKEKLFGEDIPVRAAEVGVRASGTPYRGPLEAVREPVSDEEAVSILVNLGLLGVGSFKGPERPAPVRPRRSGIARVPAAEVPSRLARVSTIDDLLTKLHDPEAVAGDVPQNVPRPPAERSYPLGATTGDLIEGGVRRPFTEPAPTPYTRKGVARRPASQIPSPQEWEASLAAAPEPTPETPPAPPATEPVPTIGEPVSVGRDPMSPVVNRRGVEPTFNTGVALPDEVASVGALPPETSRIPLGAMPKDAPLPRQPKVSAGTMLEVGKQRAIQAEQGTAYVAAPDLSPAMARTGMQFADPAAVPNPVKAPREFINYARTGLSLTDEARLRSTVERLRASGELEKEVAGFDTQAKIAERFKKEVLSNPLDLDFAKLRNISGPEAVAVRQTLAENVQLQEGIAKSLRSGELTPAEAAEAAQLMDRLDESTKGLLQAFVREAGSMGRDLGALRQFTKMSLDPDVWLVRAQRAMGENVLMSDEVMTKIRRLAREAGEVCK